MSTAIKPCLYCGAKVATMWAEKLGGAFVRCTNGRCLAEGPLGVGESARWQAARHHNEAYERREALVVALTRLGRIVGGIEHPDLLCWCPPRRSTGAGHSDDCQRAHAALAPHVKNQERGT